MSNWILENVNLLVTIGVIGIPTLIQISPLKINPWNKLSKMIKKLLYGEILEQISEISNKLDVHIVQDELDEIKRKRLRILRFNDELIQGVWHSKEHFDEILDDITAYQQYCETHTSYENAKAVMSIDNIKRIYQKCEREGSFL